MPFWAVLDACVLHPISLADTLLRVAQTEVYQPLWSVDILDELRRSVLRSRPGADIDRRIARMREAFPEAEVTGYEHLIEGLATDPDDRHVLAAAIVGKAQVVVTANLRHFPPEACEPYGIEAQHPDDFLVNALHIDSELVIGALARQAGAKRKPPITFEQLLMRLSDLVPVFAGEVQEAVNALGTRNPTTLRELLDT